MAEYPFKRIKFSDPKIECIEGDTYRIAGKIAANCVDMADKVIVEAIIAMCKDEGVAELYLIDKKFVLNAIEKALADNQNIAPTADVAEVKHGKWQEERWCDNFQHTCSLCHSTVRVHPQSVAYKYCPYCGAIMDGRKETDK